MLRLVTFGKGPQRRFYHAHSGIYGFKEAKQPSELYVPRISTDVDSALVRLVHAYRAYGHRNAQLDPLGFRNRTVQVPELDLKLYGLEGKRNSSFNVDGILHVRPQSNKLSDIVDTLKSLYCRHTAAEFMHLETLEEREWFASKFELLSQETLSKDEKRTYAKILLECQNFDHYLALKFATIKRYGAEGAESMMPFFWETFAQSPKYNLQQVIICMPHRGRLNLLTTLLEYPAVIMFQKMRGKLEFPPNVKGLGDVLSHLSTSIDLKVPQGSVHVTMIPNPSHLEANNPVAVGKARARLQSLTLGEYSLDTNNNSREGDGVLCIQVHGDASCVGQGIVPETSTMSNVPNYRVGGSVHIVVNNQIGFTTESDRARSYEYCTDVAKMVSAPVIHVNGDYPEEVAKATRLAMEYRHVFRKDVFLDLLCYRRWGHNELDDPSFTQPQMYDVIDARRNVPDIYADLLESQGVMAKGEKDQWLQEHNKLIADQLKQIDTFVPKANHLEKQWAGLVQAPEHVEIWDTGVDTNTLKYVGAKSVDTPSTFSVHPHLKKTHCDARVKKLEEGANLDWATAEALAFGSLLHEGCPVRISGQDVGRGTFSHRHVMLIDRTNDKMHIPLNHMKSDQTAFLEVANSILSEEAVLGFEYGVAIENPRRLVIWEAQFGDFFNGAQIIIDTYVTSGESKWLLQNGLVMLLPHGYDGAGPEHSSCRIERFLQLSDSKENGIDGEDVNCNIAHPTTSAQYFHLLRRQALCPFPANLLQEIVKKYNKVQTFVWSQEEPRNMGPWFFVNPRFRNLVGCQLSYAGRPELPIVANAIGEVHQREHDQVLKDTFS